MNNTIRYHAGVWDAVRAASDAFSFPWTVNPLTDSVLMVHYGTLDPRSEGGNSGKTMRLGSIARARKAQAGLRATQLEF